MSCKHPDPELCERLGFHLGPMHYELYQTRPVVRAALEELGRQRWQQAEEAAARQALALGHTAPAPLPFADTSWLPRFGTCRHLGALTGAEADCAGCPGRVRLKLLGCALHGVTTARQCEACGDWQPKYPFAGPPTRNLLCYVWPVKGSGVWQRNVQQLRQRWSVFTGRKVVAIATDEGADPPELVQQAFDDTSVEYIVQPNQPQLREVAAFLPLWGRLGASDGPDQMTFCCHAKGVTKPDNPGVSVHRWAEIMYETLLDYLPLVERLLTTYPIAGSFKKSVAGFFSSESTWHYSGSFYWIRNQRLVDRSWRRIDQSWWGTESWPGLHFSLAEGATVFYSPRGQYNLYSLAYLREAVEPALARWKERHQDDRTRGLAHAR